MFKFLKVFLIVFIQQVFFLTIFGLAVNINSDGIFFIPVLLLIIYLIFYFKYSKNVYEGIKLDKKIFSLYYFICWLITGGLITYLVFTDSWLWNILPRTIGIFSGLEYILVPLLLEFYLVVLIIINFIILLYNRIKKIK